MLDMTDVVVAGGGLAGLVAARQLAADGFRVTLFERENSVGGRVRSDREDGFILDRGFQVLFTAYPAVGTELDRGALDLRRFRAGAILARPGERTTVADPFADIRGGVRTVFNRDITFADKVRVLWLRGQLWRRDTDSLFEGARDESVEAYLAARGFSERFRERFAAPFYGGITLDRSLSTSRTVFEYTFKMLAEGAAAVPAAGMGAISDHLSDRATDAGVRTETGTPVEAVTDEERGVAVETAGETVTADAAVVATDPASARDLTGCASIPTSGRGCVTQYFSLPASQSPDTGRRLVLNVGDSRPNQVAVLSAVAPAYAPPGQQLLSATFLGEQDSDDETLAREVSETLAAWYPEHSFAGLELLRTDRIEFAQLAQPPGFHADLPSVDEPSGAVYLAGDYTEWSSIQGAIESGRRAARAVGKQLS
jgi:phytoene dehydrogenase-like protein